MSRAEPPAAEAAEDLFEDAPCGLLSTRMDGTIVRVNRTFERWTGFSRGELVGTRRFAELLSPGGRIYHETHVAPLLRMQGAVREIAVDIVRADRSRLPALVNSVVGRDGDGRPSVVRTTVFDATERRRYEQELLAASRREQEVAERLEASLLSGRLPAAPGLGIGRAYRAAVRGLDVGGDWYDAFWLEDGRSVGLVVGDVAGRGIDAAATMGQLRSAVRALAVTGLAPGPLLDALEAYVRRHDVGTMTTLVVARLELDSGELRFACAGHPPPLAIPPAAEPRFLWGGRTLPLGASLEPCSGRADATVALAPGSALVLYTDGLVERRSRPIDEGLERLAREAAARAGVPGEALAGDLERALRDPGHVDDVCVLSVRLGAGPAT